MKIYLATAYVYSALAKHWAEQLEAAGIEITHKWWKVEGPPGPETNVDKMTQRKWATEDLYGVKHADMVWVLAPEQGGCGCWIEFGFAMGNDVDVVVSGPARTIFTSLALRHFPATSPTEDPHKTAFEWIKRCAEDQ